MALGLRNQPSTSFSGFDSGRRPACVLLAIGICASAFLAPGRPGASWLTRFLFIYQDLAIALALVVAWISMSSCRGPSATSVTPRNGAMLILCLGLVLVCWLGSRIVFEGYHLSRDEQLVWFDAAIYRRGLLSAPLPPPWRIWADALNQTFLLPIGDREAWVSAYLPINAALHALVGTIDLALTGPIFVGVGALALWSIARRLWPDSPATQGVVLLLYAGSSQVLITGMTTYAMSGHLAANLVWLALFLRGGVKGHGGAILVGAFATGLHQPLFHPLFVLPFFNLMFQDRRYHLLAIYLTCYAAIAIFWLNWPVWVAAQATTVMPSELNVEGVSYVDRLIRATSGLSPAALGLMAANLVRFASWQHLLALPLAILGTRSCWNRDPITRALGIGLILPALFMLALLPYQGHGWGYRYMHGVIGNLALLGGYGWMTCRRQGDDLYRLLRVTTAASMLVLFPVHAWMAHRQASPYVQLDRMIAASPAAVVIVDDAAAPFAQDLVLNRADLRNRPIRLKASTTDPATMSALCRQASVAFLDGSRLRAISGYFDLPQPRTTQRQGKLKSSASASNCVVRPL